jgi:putative spermidine/putrescine transport system permease protein
MPTPTQLDSGMPEQPRPSKRPFSLWSAYSTVASLVIVFAVVTPILICLWGSFTTGASMGAASTQSGAGWDARAGMGMFGVGARETKGAVTLLWYRYVLDVYGGTILLSLELAALCIVITMVLGVFGGYGLVRYSFPGKLLLEELIVVPLSLPGISVAVALIGTYGLIRGSWIIILLGHLLYTLPFMIQAVTNTLRSYNFLVLERAAASLGAGTVQRLRYILLPNLKHALIIGSLLVFTISLGEFNASFLLTTPVTLTLPAALYDSYAYDSFQVSSAATSIFMIVVIPVLLAIQLLGGREMQDRGQAA